eukprot:scaffold172660_cov12-Tisochrysis_lutea.AAC.1
MEQDCTVAAHHQQATSLGQACLLACGSRRGKQLKNGSTRGDAEGEALHASNTDHSSYLHA